MICPSCGYPGMAETPGHPYLAASPACWAQYGEVLAREYSDRAYWPSHRRLVDAYCGHHSIGSDRRARQSLYVHLAGLMLHFEDGCGDADIRDFLGRTAKSGEPFAELAPPAAIHDVRLDEVHGAPDADAHHASVARYARAVFDVWSPHHGAFRGLIERMAG